MTDDRIELAAKTIGDRVRRNAPVASLTTYRLGGPAALSFELCDEDDVAVAREAVQASGVPVLVVGKGSNLLVADRGFAGLVVTLGGMFAEVDIDDNWVRAGAAVSLPVVARRSVAAGLRGLEWAVGVPGSVGGAIRMNAGGHGSQTSEALRRYRFADLRGEPDGIRTADALDLGYRRSNLGAHQVVLWADYELRPGDREEGEAMLSEIVRWRREHQPGGHNAGSVFTNPFQGSAGQLIDEAGMRGVRCGSAFVSPKHANFIQSEEGGSAADVLALIRKVHDEVLARTGVALHPEVRLVGFTDEELGDVLGASAP